MTGAIDGKTTACFETVPPLVRDPSDGEMRPDRAVGSNRTRSTAGRLPRHYWSTGWARVDPRWLEQSIRPEHSTHGGRSSSTDVLEQQH
uniref:Uncharacterized protein n=1 Tax=Thermocrispum agreste TaxID=37925 RepID=A0A2W4JGB3_9PSEU|nr:MAG: hypothetical protein DIU77_09135 [Thermocrispum agreste]